LQLNILKDTSPTGQNIRLPRQKLEALAAMIGLREKVDESAEVNLIVTGDEQVRALNKQYRQKDKTTDVLSFPMERDEFSDIIGEIYISLPRASLQANEFQHAVSHELLRLTCHGLYHIIGYDHDTDETAECMEALESSALETLKKQESSLRS
jgi:probable rRNA maturation factor